MPVVSGGTWRNPLTELDTEADDVYIETINKISQAGKARQQAKLDQETARQKAANEQIKWTMDWTMKQQDEYLDQLKTAGNKNPQLAELFMNQINDMGELAGRARTASNPEERRYYLNQVGMYKQRLSSGATTVQLMNDSTTTFNEDALNGLNNQGSLNLSNPEALEWAKKMAIVAGRNPGKVNWFIDEDGDWALDFKGPRLTDGPSQVKADVFFSYDPGIIPEYTKEIKGVLKELKFINEKTGSVADQYLTGKMVDDVFVPTAKWVNEGNGMMREVFVTDMKKVGSLLEKQLNPIADAYATSYNEAEGIWDSLPKDIKEKIMKEQGVGDDLEVGNAYDTQLNLKSLNALRQSLLLSALPLITKVKMGNERKQNDLKSNETKNQKPLTATEKKNLKLSKQANKYIHTLINNPSESFNTFDYKDDKFKYAKGSKNFFKEIKYYDDDTTDEIQYDLHNKGDIIRYFRRRFQDKKITRAEFDAIEKRIEEIDVEALLQGEVDILEDLKTENSGTKAKYNKR